MVYGFSKINTRLFENKKSVCYDIIISINKK